MNAFLTQAPVAWYVVRAAGLVALGALTFSVWLGLALSTRLLGAKRMRWLLGWHRTIAWTGLSMLALHAGALLFDPTLHFGIPALLVPFAAPWRPVAVAAGVVTGWLTLAIASSFHLRKWIGQKGWRRLHYATFSAFVLALGHALAAGTDLRGVGGPILAAVAAGPVIWLGLARVLMPRAAPARGVGSPALGAGH
jgi:methionine sulfoxide reductase heme-binding subunit